MAYQQTTRNKTKKENHQKKSLKITKTPPSINPLHPMLQLQQKLGNQAVNRFIQTKLTMSQPGDKYEQEAEQVSKQVMGIPKPKIQRVCPECEEELQRQSIAQEEEEETLQTQPLAEQITPLVQKQTEPMEEEEEILQTKTASEQPSTVSSSLQNRITALNGGGNPLPPSERAFFEPRFGADFSQVRLHTDSQAAETASAVNARAFTFGENIVFGAGEYQPSGSQGRHLLAHELTHVVQQTQPSKVQIQLSPDLRFGNRTRILRVPWHGNYDIFRLRVRRLAIRQLEVPVGWIDQLMNPPHHDNLRSTHTALDQADYTRPNGTTVVIRAQYSARNAALHSRLVFDLSQTSVEMEEEPITVERPPVPETEREERERLPEGSIPRPPIEDYGQSQAFWSLLQGMIFDLPLGGIVGAVISSVQMAGVLIEFRGEYLRYAYRRGWWHSAFWTPPYPRNPRAGAFMSGRSETYPEEVIERYNLGYNDGQSCRPGIYANYWRGILDRRHEQTDEQRRFIEYLNRPENRRRREEQISHCLRHRYPFNSPEFNSLIDRVLARS